MIAAVLATGACNGGEDPSAVAQSSTSAEAPALPPIPQIDDPLAAAGLDALRREPALGWPVESVHITSYFGWRVDPVSGKGTRLHRGLDLRGRTGDLVLSVGDGTVAFVGHDPLLGNMVVVDHGDGLESLYGHLDAALVHAGLAIPRGATVGLVGNTGRSEAPHLHLTIKLHDVAIDPLLVLGQPPHAPTALVTNLRDDATSTTP